MTYDPARREVVLFGGDGGLLHGDTWTWDGATWNEETPSTIPPARSGAAMVFDAAIGEVVMFGGYGESGFLHDTWTWNGSDWTERSINHWPPARGSFGMAYDARRGEVVLFGGQGLTLLHDTWIWNGSWRFRPATDSPSNRRDPGMAYDVARGQVVLFGGGRVLLNESTDSKYLRDTWTWDGSTWTRLSPALSPPERYLMGMAYDVSHRQVVVFGGYNNGAYLGDTWIWDGTTWIHR